MSVNTKPLDVLWAVMSRDKKGNEGICAINTSIGPQVAVTGEKRLLDLYVDTVKRGKDEVPNDLEIVIAEFKRTETTKVDL